MQLQLKNDSKSTAVPNRFIECCIKAPEKYTQVYLLTLMYASNNEEPDFKTLCARLNMSQHELMSIFEYWQDKGLAIIENKNNSIGLKLGVYYEPDGELYTEKEYNLKLQSIFGSRQLSPYDYNKIYDFTEIFKLPKKVVILLVEYYIQLKGKRVSIQYIDAVAKSWAEEGIDTEEKAIEKISYLKARHTGLLRVLNQLGISDREPTKDETDLFEKWTELWGFTLEAIITACSKTTAARDPSMKYLDKILSNLYEKGNITSRNITDNKVLSEKVTTDLQKLMRIIGEVSLKPSLEYKNLYHKWMNVYGFNMDMLSFAARITGSHGSKPLSFIDSVLTDWYNKHILTVDDAKAYITERKALDEPIKAVFKMAGISRGITDAHRKAYGKWNTEWSINHDAILLAAEISSLSENPYRYLNTILTNWHNAGVKTLKDAQQDTKKYSVKSSVPERASYERPVGKYDNLAVDPFADEGA